MDLPTAVGRRVGIRGVQKNVVAAEYNTPVEKSSRLLQIHAVPCANLANLYVKPLKIVEWQTEIDDCDHSISSESDGDNSIDSGNSDNDETPIEIGPETFGSSPSYSELQPIFMLVTHHPAYSQ